MTVSAARGKKGDTPVSRRHRVLSRAAAAARHAWSARLPTLILIGARTTGRRERLYEQMVAGARGRTARAAITVYPGAHHDFDHPDLPLQQRNGCLSRPARPAACMSAPTGGARDALKRVAEMARTLDLVLWVNRLWPKIGRTMSRQSSGQAAARWRGDRRAGRARESVRWRRLASARAMCGDHAAQTRSRSSKRC